VEPGIAEVDAARAIIIGVRPAAGPGITLLQREHQPALQLQRREKGFELLEQLALLEPLVDRLVFRAAWVVVLDLDHIVLQHRRRLGRSRSTRNEAAEDQRQSTNGGTSGRDAVHGDISDLGSSCGECNTVCVSPCGAFKSLTQLNPESTWC